MKSAAELTRLIERYLGISDKIDLLKQDLLKTGAEPVDYYDWSCWIRKQARKRKLDYQR